MYSFDSSEKFLNVLNIKTETEIDIKDELLKLTEEYLSGTKVNINEESLESGYEHHSNMYSLDYNALREQNQTFGSCFDLSNFMKVSCNNSVKTEDDANEICEEKNVDNLHEVKTEEYGDEFLENVSEETLDKGNYETKFLNSKKILDEQKQPLEIISSASLNFLNYSENVGTKEDEHMKASSSQEESQRNIILLCSVCNYHTNVIESFKRHLKTHPNLKLFKCGECDYECHQKRYLKSHLITHANLKLFKCSECDYESNRKGNLKVHMLSHSNVMLFKCQECNYKCNKKYSFKLHLLSHSNVYLFKCQECDYKTNLKSRLKLHLLTHSNVKLFECHKCDYGCNQKRYLRKHILIHVEKKLKCSECDYEGKQKRDLTSHIILNHSK